MPQDITSSPAATLWQVFGISGLVSTVISATISVIGWKVAARSAARLAVANRIVADRRDLFTKKYDAPTAELFNAIQKVTIPTTAAIGDYSHLKAAASQISQKAEFLSSFFAILDLNRLVGLDAARVELTDIQSAVGRFAISLEGIQTQASFASVAQQAFLEKCDAARTEQQQLLLAVLSFRMLLERMSQLDIQLD